MPKAFLVADWETQRGAAGETITQSFEKRLNLGGFVDVVFYTECSYVSGSPVLSMQTSPVNDDDFFGTMTMRSLTAGSSINQDKVLFASATVPLSNHVRWSITDSSAWAATFRIWAVARPG